MPSIVVKNWISVFNATKLSSSPFSAKDLIYRTQLSEAVVRATLTSMRDAGYLHQAGSFEKSQLWTIPHAQLLEVYLQRGEKPPIYNVVLNKKEYARQPDYVPKKDSTWYRPGSLNAFSLPSKGL